MVKKRPHLVVLGAGMAGLRLVQNIQHKLPRYWRITLVDQRYTHVFPADLYQVATVFNEVINEECMLELKETVATPISRLVDPWRVDFVRNTVTGIDSKKKKILMKEGSPMHYDALVVALGSVNNDFGTPGVSKYGFHLKTVSDALKINCHIDQLFHKHWKEGAKEDITITVVGGGPTGVETAGELIGTLKHLCKKYHYPHAKVSVHLIQSGETLAAFEKKGTRLIKKRLTKLGVKVMMGCRVVELKKGEAIVLDKASGKKSKKDSDMLIWTAGVKVNPVVSNSIGDSELRGAVKVDEYLSAVDHEDIFALGDNAAVEDPKSEGRFLPMNAQVAMKGADILGNNLLRFLKSRHFRGGDRWKPEEMRGLQSFKSMLKLYLVPVGPHFALFQMGRFVFQNIFVYFLKSLIGLRYSWGIMPLRKAYKKWRDGKKIFVTND